jgi:hypothetical protein
MVPENCVLVHPKCHMEHGQTKAFRAKALDYAVGRITAEKIGVWYDELRVTVPSLAAGILIPRKDIPVSKVLEYLKIGARLHGIELSDDANYWTGEAGWDYRAQVAWYWTRRRPRNYRAPAPFHIDFALPQMLFCIREGYWYEYLKGIA